MLLTFDVDGVLLDYTEATGKAMRSLGLSANARPGKHYHCRNKFGFDPHELPEATRAAFYELFDRTGWEDMPEIPGAAQALRELAAAGHEIRYLTSMPVHRSGDRLRNLAAHGFPEGVLAATGHRIGPGHHPKASFLEAWKPDWFVDDWAYNFAGAVPSSTRFALILDGSPDHPNLNAEAADRALAHAEFPSVELFAQSLLEQGSLRPFPDLEWQSPRIEQPPRA